MKTRESNVIYRQYELEQDRIINQKQNQNQNMKTQELKA